jgi:hypothetical protein
MGEPLAACNVHVDSNMSEETNGDSDSNAGSTTVVSSTSNIDTTVGINGAVVAEGADDETAEMDVQTHEDNFRFYDNFPCLGPTFKRLSELDKQIVLWAIERRSVVVKHITYYLYCENMAWWWRMESLNASQELLGVIGINAPVYYAAALRRIYLLLTRVACPAPLIRSVCMRRGGCLR